MFNYCPWCSAELSKVNKIIMPGKPTPTDTESIELKIESPKAEQPVVGLPESKPKPQQPTEVRGPRCPQCQSSDTQLIMGSNYICRQCRFMSHI